MADAVQWTIDQFWSQLQKLQSAINNVANNLNADKAQLTALWHATTIDGDKKRAADNQRLLTPLIHQNSVLRLSYLAPIRDKFKQAVTLSSKALAGAGYTTPTLNDVGEVVTVVSIAAVALVVAALSAVAIVAYLTQAQRNATAAVARVVSDTTTTPEQKAALLEATKKTIKAAPPPPGLDFSSLVVPLVLVAAIVIVPKMMGRKAAA